MSEKTQSQALAAGDHIARVTQLPLQILISVLASSLRGSFKWLLSTVILYILLLIDIVGSLLSLPRGIKPWPAWDQVGP